LQDLPLEYNTWLLFRQAVDIILIKWVSIMVVFPGVLLMLLCLPSDFLSFCLFAFACFRVPSGLSMLVHVLRRVPSCHRPYLRI
jgi:phosphatidylethanolamine N-methyltransferase